jgi:hypothetical protein
MSPRHLKASYADRVPVFFFGPKGISLLTFEQTSMSRSAALFQGYNVRLDQ